MVPADADRAPNLDSILARLAALAPLDSETGGDERSAAPLPETASTLRQPILDLTRIAEATDRLAPAELIQGTVGVDSPATLDYADGPDGSIPGAEPIIDLRVGDEAPVAAVVEPEIAAPEVPEPEIAEPEVPEPPAESVDTSIQPLVEESPADQTVEPLVASPAGDLIDIRRPYEGASAPGATTPKAPKTRTVNPFRHLILWSVALGIVLLVVAGVVILT